MELRQGQLKQRFKCFEVLVVLADRILELVLALVDCLRPLRLICTPDARKSQPAFSAATLGITEPWSPTGDTTPITTSSTSAVSNWWRCCKSVSRPASRLMGLTSCRLPSFFPLPRGVRMASNTNASVMVVVLRLNEGIPGANGAWQTRRSPFVQKMQYILFTKQMLCEINTEQLYPP